MEQGKGYNIMKRKVELLDCTLRDGAYIVNAQFGIPALKGIIKKMQDANVDIIECGWLKDNPHEKGSSFFHTPDDLKLYLYEKSVQSTYAAMIDWNRYNLDFLPTYDGTSIDAIRVVFPHGKYKEGIAVGEKIKKKGYQVFFQAANTLAYNQEELLALADEINRVNPASISIVDTFGAMYENDLERIATILDQRLNKDIKLGFHSHNNQQLSFALTMLFVRLFSESDRKIIVDASLCGMGRGAGNAPTELTANFLNAKHHCNYDMNMVMDAIDMYMQYFKEKYQWGYSTEYFIAGMYCCHVNNIAYLLRNHRTNTKDMRSVIESMSSEERKQYDYDLLEQKYLENQNRQVDDAETILNLSRKFRGRTILLLAPGKSIETDKAKILQYIKEEDPVIVGVNALHPDYRYDFVFFTNTVRYYYAKEVYTEQFSRTPKILLSNIKTKEEEGACEYIINFNMVIKRGWEHFDNAMILCLRLMNKLRQKKIAIAGFDGFKTEYNESYADISLPTLNPDNKWDDLNEEIKDMFQDFFMATRDTLSIVFVTESLFHN